MVRKWAIAAACACIAGTAAAGSNIDSGPLAAIDKEIEAGAYEEVLADLTVYVRKNPASAAAFHRIGYTNRKLGRLEKAEKAYARARHLDPDHKSAFEHMGELWKTLEDLGRLDRQLAVLNSICRFGRQEFDELMAEIAASKNMRPITPSGWLALTGRSAPE